MKDRPDGYMAKDKARLFAKGFFKIHGLDFLEVFPPIARLQTIRLVVALANFKELKLFQLDVK